MYIITWREQGALAGMHSPMAHRTPVLLSLCCVSCRSHLLPPPPQTTQPTSPDLLKWLHEVLLSRAHIYYVRFQFSALRMLLLRQ